MPGFASTLDTTNLGSFGFEISGGAVGDEAGWSVSSAGDVNNDGFDDFLVGAPGVGGSNNGAAYVVFGKGTPFGPIDLGTLTLADGFRIDGAASNDDAGYSVSSAGDINNDGFDDIIVGAERTGASDAGTAYVLFGKATGFANLSLASLAAADGFAIQGSSGRLGHSVSSAGDINNDGFDDLIVGAPNTANGTAYVIFGKATGFTTINVGSLAAADGFSITGAAASDLAGISVSSAGDINNDGFADIIVGASGNDASASNAGTSYVLFGKASGFGNINLASLLITDGFAIRGAAANDGAGTGVSSAGDFNNDGFDDLIVGAPGVNGSPGNEDVGRAYLIFGKASGFSTLTVGTLAPPDGIQLVGVGRSDQTGFDVSAAGDVNNDGFADLIIGTNGADAPPGIDTGLAFVVFGRAGGTGTIDLSRLTASEGFRIQGEAMSAQLGRSASAAGDINNDGFDDIIVGASAANEGSAYVIYGRSTAGTPTLDNGASDQNYATAYTEGGTPAAIVDSNVMLTAAGAIASVTVRITDPRAGDMLTLSGSVPGNISDSGSGTFTLTLTGPATAAEFAQALAAVRFSSSSDNPTNFDTDAARVLTIAVNTGEGDQLVGFTDVAITGVDDPAVARNDGFGLLENAGIINGNLVFNNNGAGVDSDPDSPAETITVIAVNGSAMNVGTQIVLPSGALLTVNANGSFSYNHNNAFLSTPHLFSGATNTPAFDTFTYTINGGSTATVTMEITGLDSADVLFGPAGPNTLAGGASSDTYFLDNPGDRVIEEAGGGNRDVIRVTFSYTMNAGAWVEVLTPVDQEGTEPFVLVGNELNQEIYGNAGDNFLQGGGGTDYLIGLGGNDTYFVTGPGDNVDEDEGGGARDVIYTPGSYTMAGGLEVEVLSSSNQAGTAPVTLLGNEFGQEIYANAGNNFIYGGGGTDVLIGLAGNDTYLVDSADDYVGESPGGGRDVVYTTGSYTLGAGQEIEVLSTTSTAGTDAIDLTGNNLANEIYGNAGANVLNGGAGGDYLVGYGGADTFQFTTALGGGNVDALADFSVVDDTIALDDAVFTGLTPGALPAGAFVTGSAAGEADDRIVYNSATGQLFFDADGNGAGAAVLFATVQPGTVLTASDFTVI